MYKNITYWIRNSYFTSGYAHKYFCNYVGRGGNLDDYLIWQEYGKITIDKKEYDGI